MYRDTRGFKISTAAFYWNLAHVAVLVNFSWDRWGRWNSERKLDPVFLFVCCRIYRWLWAMIKGFRYHFLVSPTCSLHVPPERSFHSEIEKVQVNEQQITPITEIQDTCPVDILTWEHTSLYWPKRHVKMRKANITIIDVNARTWLWCTKYAPYQGGDVDHILRKLNRAKIPHIDKIST